MDFRDIVEAGGVALVALLLVLREVLRRARLKYEYRWETFAVRGPGGRQLLHIRQTEIQSVARLTLWKSVTGIGRLKHMSRRTFGPKVIIHSKVAHTTPYVVSWEGKAIAGLTPRGLRLKAGESSSPRT
jgi:hypothetical protein